MKKLLSGKKIILVVGGGIAAYKSLDLIRILKKKDCEIKVVLTESGKKFVTPLSLASLSKNKVYQNIFDSEQEAEMDHISLSRWSDIILFSPITANSMAKLASGKADDLASTLLLASNKQVILAPAMNVRMWLHKSTQNNLNKLLDFGYLIVGPTTGEMACGEYGKGKMSSPEEIYEFIKNYFFERNLVKNKNLKALVTAGPTKEYIDPVRFITNNSSGKQGYEIANSLAKLGVKTTLISGPSSLKSPENVKVVKEDVQKYNPSNLFDRIVSIEMFEHMRNPEIIMKRAFTWLNSEGKLFLQVFSHRTYPQFFDNVKSSWMSRNFFTGGLMPYDGFYTDIRHDLVLNKIWRESGISYHHTLEAWLNNLDRNREKILPHLDACRMSISSRVFLQQYRFFLIFCSELFNFNNGNDWYVINYLFDKTGNETC